MANEQINQLAALPLPVQPTDKLIVQRGAARATALEVQNSGLVTGPAAATNSAVALYDGVTGKLLKDGPLLGGAAVLNVGAIAGTVAAGNDARFTDARTPTAHATTHVTGGTDVIASAVAGGNAGLMTGTDKTKLDGIEAGADVTDAANVGTAIDGSAAKVTPIDADTVALIDSAAANVLKKVTWANVKATLKTYFDTLYATAASIANMVTAAAVIGDTKLVVGSGGARGVAESSLSGIPLLTSGVPTASNVTNDVQTKAAIVPNTAPAAGEILVGNAGGTAYAKAAVSADATLASTGALTIANDAVTLAKMANIDGTAAEVVLGRSTASSGDPELLATTGTRGSAVVLANSPTLVTPALGTPASGVMTNVTGTAKNLTAGGNPFLYYWNFGVM